MTARFHDHGEILGLPGKLRRPLRRRLEVVNAIQDEIHATYGGVCVDLASRPEIHQRAFWSVDRLHPSELGHRALARAFGAELLARGFTFDLPAPESDGHFSPNWRTDLVWMVTEGAPWVGRRARDLGPWAIRVALTETRAVRAPRSAATGERGRAVVSAS
ncbi:hypothetical protein [Nocardioides sp. AE5]|uniref:hypothetical protein n=1 Tax=Nocardioides sp. AE5 TaxID=2962573 RepID=UPI002881BDCC|nr:hypothetical protein [Nocardioides sp. AE5]MDT0201798.1 hypothetical protein [Nocardioides sp. AE5]